MAEEEVLDEKPVAAKKEKGGGVTLGQLVLIGVILIVVTALSTVFVTGTFNKKFGSVSDTIKGVQTSIMGQRAQMEDRPTVKACDQVYRLTEDPMIINMADGEHYISTEIAVCVDPGEISESDFQMRIPQIRHVVNDSLSRIRKDDLFGTSISKEQEDEMAALGLEATGDGSDAYVKNLNRYRGKLLQDLANNFTWISDLYFESFLIQ
ncbi:MAG: flagellar basal body-associated FliL family protein [bacterium]